MAFVPPNSGASSIPETGNNTKPYSTSQYPDGTSFSFEGDALQAYIKHVKPVALSQPGYEVYFYSRMDTATLVDQNKKQSFKDITPTLALLSKIDRDKVAIVSDVNVVTSVTPEGSYGTIVIQQPKGIDFFNPTIGDKTIAPPDYDFSPQRKAHRIGTMDTVIVKMVNTTNDLSIGLQRETVFRGVVGEIFRKTEVSGSTIQIRVYDFAEFLRRCMAVKNGIFATISFSLTGRGLIYNGLNYSNHMLNGDLSLFGIGISGKDANKVLSNVSNTAQNAFNFLSANGDVGKITVTPPEQEISFRQHQMLVPPFFYLEFSDKLKDDDTAIGASNAGIPQQLFDAIKAKTQNAWDAYTSLITNQAALTQRGAIGVNHPEDAETVKTYAVATTAQKKDLQTNPGVAGSLSDIQKWAWIASDLYLEKGLITFEHQYIWDLIQQTAGRSMREAYFDIRPKISATASKSYQSATVVEQKGNRELDDLHPNIGVLKYRLSPCFTPYRENNNGSYFFHYKFTDDDVISYESLEKERDVYTAVLGYGYGTGRNSNTDAMTQLALGESRDFAFASSIDQNLERRVGYRFMSDHDAKFQVPILRGFVAYVLLLKSQLSMFSAKITVPGRPDVIPGSIVRLDNKGVDYYCTQVEHVWSIARGYTTNLVLGFGHTKGRLPGALIDPQGDTEIADLICTQTHKILEPFTKKTPTVGDVSVECLTSALWNFWCGGTTDSATIRAHTKELQGKNFTDSADQPDWIRLVTPTMPSNYNQIIATAISNKGLDQYNVTVNLVKDLIQHESHWDPTPSHTDYNTRDGSIFGVSYGWFQIEFFGDNDRSDITKVEAKTNFTKACDVAMNILLGAYSVGPKGCTGQAFLMGLSRYNTGPNTNAYNAEYVTAVLQDQAVAIANNNQRPNNSAAKVLSNQGGWPYYTYGPCGIRVAQVNPDLGFVNPAAPTANYNAVKNKLLDFNSGMALSVNYITSILNHLKDTPVRYTFQSSGGKGEVHGVFDDPKVVNQSSLLEKAIAAWYSNEIQWQYDPNFDVQHFIKVKAQIINLYQSCLNCNQVTNPYLFDGFNPRGTLNQRIVEAAQHLRGQALSTNVVDSGGQNIASNGCVYDVQAVLQEARIKPIGGGSVDGRTLGVVSDVPTFVSMILQGRGVEISVNNVQPGDIWAVDGGAYHTGVVMQVNPIMILSNSSHQDPGHFSWFDTPDAEAQGGVSRYFRILTEG